MIFKIALFKLFITVFCSIRAIVSEVPLMYDIVVDYTVHQSTSETIARILQPYNIRVAHQEPIAPVAH